jgi:hypothetical protein
MTDETPVMRKKTTWCVDFTISVITSSQELVKTTHGHLPPFSWPQSSTQDYSQVHCARDETFEGKLSSSEHSTSVASCNGRLYLLDYCCCINNMKLCTAINVKKADLLCNFLDLSRILNHELILGSRIWPFLDPRSVSEWYVPFPDKHAAFLYSF